MDDLSKELMAQRTLTIGEVTDESTNEFIRIFWLLAKKKNKDKITVIINSPGGDIDHGRAMYDIIHKYTGETSALIYGNCSSISAIILQAFKDRAMSQSAVMLLHDGTQSQDLNARDFEQAGKQSAKDRQWIYNVLAARCGRTAQFWGKRCSRDTYYTAKEALRFGLIDRII